MLATYFQWRIPPEKEAEFTEQWTRVTKLLLDERSNGSALFRNERGDFCALARWPDRETRDAAFANPEAIAASTLMRACIIDEIARVDMDEISNLWVTE